MTVHNSKAYKKLDKYTASTIDLAIDRLKKRYSLYRKQNDVITTLFGDDVIVHEVIDNNFYVYKCQSRNVQIRLLYEVKHGKVNVIDFFIKNHDNELKHTIGKYNAKYLTMFKLSVKKYREENEGVLISQ